MIFQCIGTPGNLTIIIEVTIHNITSTPLVIINCTLVNLCDMSIHLFLTLSYTDGLKTIDITNTLSLNIVTQ